VVLDCVGAGVSMVNVILENSANPNDKPYGVNGRAFNCRNGGIDGYVENYLPPATYKIILQASGTAGVYETNALNPPTVTVAAGQFPTLQTTGVLLSLAR
jgi:hypothetical protein